MISSRLRAVVLAIAASLLAGCATARSDGGTTVNVGNLAIAALQLEATPAASARRRYMALAG